MSIKVYKGVEGEGKTQSEKVSSYFKNLRDKSHEFYERRYNADKKDRLKHFTRMLMLAMAIEDEEYKRKMKDQKISLLSNFGILLTDVKDTFNDIFDDLFNELDKKSEIEKHKKIEKEVEDMKKRKDIDYKTVVENLNLSSNSENMKNIGIFSAISNVALKNGVIDKSEMANALKVYLTLSDEEVLMLKVGKNASAVVLIEELDSNQRIREKREQHLALKAENKLDEKVKNKLSKPKMH